MKTVEYKFNPLDEIYWILSTNRPAEGKCPFCLGDGEFIRKADGASVKCQFCKGTGKVNIGYNATYEVFKGYIDEVRIFIDEEGTRISYNVSQLGHRQGVTKNFEEKDLYNELYEASDKCEKLNKEGAMGSRGTYGTT